DRCDIAGRQCRVGPFAAGRGEEGSDIRRDAIGAGAVDCAGRRRLVRVPGAFAPVALQYATSRNAPGKPTKVLLSDGGVVDNTGLALLMASWAKSGAGPIRCAADSSASQSGARFLLEYDAREAFSIPSRTKSPGHH